MTRDPLIERAELAEAEAQKWFAEAHRLYAAIDRLLAAADAVPKARGSDARLATRALGDAWDNLRRERQG